MRMAVRSFRRSDLAEILNIERASFEEPYDEWVFESALARPNIFLVAEHEGRPVGYVLALLEGAEAHVVSIAVAPDWRRRGFALKLFEALFEEAKRLGGRTVRLEVDAENAAAKSLYERLGFTVTGRLKRYYANGHDALVMAKKL